MVIAIGKAAFKIALSEARADRAEQERTVICHAR
jgi:hypothetical protein